MLLLAKKEKWRKSQRKSFLSFCCCTAACTENDIKCYDWRMFCSPNNTLKYFGFCFCFEERNTTKNRNLFTWFNHILHDNKRSTSFAIRQNQTDWADWVYRGNLFFSVPIFAAERNQRWMLKAVLRFFYGNKENSLWKFDLSVFPRLGTVNCTHIHILTFKRLEWHLSSNCKRIGTKLNKIATIWYIAA